jgi:hypothetical protein
VASVAIRAFDPVEVLNSMPECKDEQTKRWRSDWTTSVTRSRVFAALAACDEGVPQDWLRAA